MGPSPVWLLRWEWRGGFLGAVGGWEPAPHFLCPGAHPSLVLSFPAGVININYSLGAAVWGIGSRGVARRIWGSHAHGGHRAGLAPPGMPRLSVDSPRDWYRSMFRQIHRKLPGERGGAGAAQSERSPAPAQLLHPQSPTGTPIPAPQVLLEQELEQLSEELDKDMRDMETRRTPRQVPGPLPLPLGPCRASSCGHTQLWAHPAVGFLKG
uniref:SoHo domain-containing protein n=1 Tax=Ficedula albicollis TaxID=59894 RepID=A0A803V844_FICAL